ncbi:hypothetical protein NFC81_07380 [Salinispirillum sp. LH 10-3-1]|uniref:Uncharacterized protein n=1 Tax=Salinispirillum sp. LH 10-3-1 TaxID=2952525 RepID=A0AB38YL10_9GAMM
MAIEYSIALDDSATVLSYIIATDHEEVSTTRAAEPASWTLLGNNQCTNCPLSAKEHERCPAAVDLQKVIEDFSTLPALRKASITVKSPEREYFKHTGIEEGLRSLMGLLMASCACPILSKLKPMAVTHLPFASQREFIIRSVGTYLLRQYFHHNDKDSADWSLEGLIDLNKELQLVNQAMWQRVHGACQGDSNLKALLSFFTMASSVSYSLETQLQKIRPAFLAATDLAPYEKL